MTFKDHSASAARLLEDAAEAWLREGAEMIREAAAEESPVDTGALRDSWQVTLDASEGRAQIGSGLENAAYTEYGTGRHAEGGGRQTPWVYRDSRGEFHATRGKRALHPLQKAHDRRAERVKALLRQKLKEMIA